MNKKAWFIILAVTSVVTVFTFASTWVLRPNSSTAAYADKIFEEAKARQEQPLVSVSEPLRTNVEEISAEEKMAQSVAQLLASDQSFIEELSVSINHAISDNLDSWGNEYQDSIISKVTEMNATSRKEMSEEIAKSANSVTTKFNGKLSAQDAKMVADVQEAKKFAEEMFVTSTKTSKMALEDLKNYIESELGKTRSNTEKSIAELNGLIETKSMDAENYINQKSLDLTTYTDIKAKTNEDYSSTLLNEAKSYIDNAVLDLRHYVDQRILEYEEELSFRPISIHTQLPIFNDYVDVDAYRGYAVLSFPEYVVESDLKAGMDELYAQYPELNDVVVFRVGHNDVVATYPQDLNEEDILFGLDAIANLLAQYEFVPPVVEEPGPAPSIEQEVPEEEVVAVLEEDDIIPVRDEVITVPVEEETPVSDPYDFALSFNLYIGEDGVAVNVDSDSAEFVLPANIPDETIYDWISMLIMAYPEETSVFDFSVDDKVVTVGFIEKKTKNEVISYLDAISSFYTANMPSMLNMLVPGNVEIEEIRQEEVAVVAPMEEISQPEEVGVNQVESVVEDVDKISLHKEYMLFDSKITLDATDGGIVIVVPSFVSETEIVGAMDAVAKAYPEESSGLAFSVDGNAITFDYLRAYTEEELGQFLENARVVVFDYINMLLTPKVSIHKEYDLLGHAIVVDATDKEATITVPPFVSKDEMIGALNAVAEAYPSESAGFVYSIDANTITLGYEAKYSEDELESYIEGARDVVWNYVKLLLTPAVPAKPANFSVSTTLVTRVPAPPRFVPAKPPVFTAQPEIADEDIPAIRNAIRNIEVERYLKYL